MLAPDLIIDRAEPKDFEVWPENLETVRMFLRLATQWRAVSGMGGGGLIGLDYNAVRWLFELYHVEDQQQLLEDLQVMEIAALNAMRED